ncbi:MAG: NAD-binding protein [Acidimicrobiales bacterium]|jgi:Trk K+ transport system NAD-binding subunit
MEQAPVAGWQGHVIVCGLQGVGLRMVEQLHQAGVQVVVVDEDPDPRLVRIVEAWDIPFVVGSPRIGGFLDRAGLAAARAVVCAERTEVQTLETALLVSERRPDIRVVVQLANAAVGAAVSQVTGPGTVLDVAALAAPSIVEACLGSDSFQIELGGTLFKTFEVEVERYASIRALFGALAPIGVVPADASSTVACPGRDLMVGIGDRVTVLGTPAELEQAGLVAKPEDGGPGLIAHRHPGGAGLVRRISALLGSDDNSALRFAFVAASALIVLSTVILRLAFRLPGGGHMTVLTALYFTVETISTVGYGDFSFAHQSTAMEIFGIILIAGGATLLTTVFALITNVLVTWRIEQSLGRQQLVGLEDHVVVIGLGSVGIRVLEGLQAAGRQVVVVEQNENNRFLNQARALGAPVLIADSTQRQTLEDANVHAASAVAVLTSDDLTNIETGLAVRDYLGDRWVSVPVVLRVFDRELGHTVEHHFDFRHVRSTSALAAPRFVGAALGLDILGSFTVGNQPFLVGRLTVAPGRGLDGLAMVDLPAQTRVIALSRAADGGRLEHPPRRDTRFAPGDQAYVLGPYEELLRVLRHEHEGDIGSAV